MDSSEIKILLADDHQIIIDGLKSLLSTAKNIRVIGEASNGKEVCDFLKLIKADLILMDIDMPVMNGIEATKKIKQSYPDVRIIILSMHNEPGLIKTMISAGADGYLIKNCDQNELLDAVHKVASGQNYFSTDVTMSLLEKGHVSVNSISGDNHLAELTSREIEILTLIAEGYSNKEIGDKLFISHRTVDTHRTNLMKKLEVNNIAGLIRFAIKQGFIS
ncbi:MAG: response regulator transcription factor [Bacteroidales bacterium]|nr:response regulator transcription factor [Bacteroidales bacterium]MCF8404738.1 response regulator transcription factor [Bacteroidales bacterium]